MKESSIPAYQLKAPSAIAAADGASVREAAMPYALFEGDEKLTRSFPTREEVWRAAERAGLLVPGADGEMVLDDHFEIKPCEADRNEVSDPGSDFIFN